ncbi:unnamed protein product, partial [Acanthoscelides obtectus]
RGSLKIGQPGR